jgi:phytoene synthase
MGRRYIPANWVDLPATEIAEANINSHQPIAIAVDRLLNLAEDYYQSALLGIQLLPLRSRLSIIIALRVYRQIGWVLKRRSLPWWQGRVFVTKQEKAFLSLRSLGDLIPLKVPAHKKDLHRHLQGLAGV